MTAASTKLLRTQSDDRLAALAATGHERAFEAIVERYRRPLLRHCRRFLPEARAEDALQLALVAAWSALRRGDDVRELRPWLYRIVHNTALNSLRASGYEYEQLHDALQGTGGPAELAENSALLRQTLAGLAALPERQREALMRIAVEGRSQDEVAAQLGLSHGAVRQLVHRARSSLRAAATAVTPLPLAGWLAGAGGARGDVAARVGELIAGAGGGATLAKAGAVAVLAGTALGGPAVVNRLDADRGTGVDAAIAAPARAAEAGRERRGEPRAEAQAATSEPGMLRRGPAQRGDEDGSGTGSRGDRDLGSRSGHGGGDDRSGRGPGSGGRERGGDGSGDDDDGGGPGPREDSGRGPGDGGSSGPGGGDDGSPGPRGGDDGSPGPGGDDGSSGPGGNDGSSGPGAEHEDSGSRESGGEAVEATATPVPTFVSSGSGSGTSGSGSSGSSGSDGGDSGSGGSGSGTELDD
jgi:RNA polymerase sigma factor (sigma-70 family)